MLSMFIEPRETAVGHDRAGAERRVLIEAGDWRVAEATMAAFRAAGWRAQACTGPDLHVLHCPFTAGEGCPLVEDVDVVVTRIPLADERNRHLLARLRRDAPGVVVVVETPAALAERYRHELEGCEVLALPARLDDLVARAGWALEARRR
jgi:hypothetical protein